jgi:type I restriction enzyme S subunit
MKNGTRCKPYPRYKDSGVEWLGYVPETWSIKAIKRETPIWRGASPRPIDDQIFFDAEGAYAWVRISDVTAAGKYLRETLERLSDLGSSLSVKLEPGSLFLSIAGSVGKPCITEIKCCIHDGFVYFPRWKGEVRFLFYVFDSGEPYRGLGKMGTQLNLNTETVGLIKIALPSFQEQRGIADFLDRETAKIDELIARKERLIELLEEKRAALITHAITRGLNPDAPLRDSGIEWLGQIPTHWEVYRLSRLIDPIRKITYGIVQPGDRDSNGRFMVRGKDYSGEWAAPEEIFRVSDAIERPYARSRLKPGDLLITIVGAGIGNTAVVPDWLDGANITQTTARVSISNKRAAPLFVRYALESKIGAGNVANSAKGAAQPGLTLDSVARFLIPLPDAEEQRGVIEFLDSEMSKLNGVKKHIEMAIDKLREYRAALITSAVTGKIDVRDVEAAA